MKKRYLLLLTLCLSLCLCLSVSQATVSSTVPRIQYTGGGGVTSFPFTFGVKETSEIQVILTTVATGVETVLEETTHYSVACTNSDCTSGGTVNTVATYTSASQITIRLNVALTQASDFVENQPTLYETFEDALDKLTRIVKQIDDRVGRGPLLKKSSSLTGINFPDPGAGYYIRWNAAGTALEAVSAVNDSGSYLASGTGAVSRSVSSKLGEIVSVKDFGAVGDGVTDDTAAIQAAIASVPATYAGNIKFGPFPVKITSPLLVDKSWLTLDLDGGAIYQATVDTDAIQLAKAVPGGSERRNITVKNGYIISGTGSGNGINADTSLNMTLENLTIWSGSTSGKGIWLKTCYFFKIDKINMTGNITIPYGISHSGIAQDGIVIDAQSDTGSITNFDIAGVTRDSINIPGTSGVSSLTIGPGRWDVSGRYGIYAGYLSRSEIKEVSGENNTTMDIYLTYSTQNKFSRITGNKGVTLASQNMLNTFHEMSFSVDAPFTISNNTNTDNTFMDCLKIGTTVPSDAGLRTSWVNLIDGNTTLPIYRDRLSGIDVMRYSGSLTDGGVYILPLTTNGGWGMAQIGDGQEYGFFSFTSAGVVTLISNSANTQTSIADNKFIIYDGGTGVYLRNELGSTLTINVVIHF